MLSKVVPDRSDGPLVVQNQMVSGHRPGARWNAPQEPCPGSRYGTQIRIAVEDHDAGRRFPIDDERPPTIARALNRRCCGSCRKQRAQLSDRRQIRIRRVNLVTPNCFPRKTIAFTDGQCALGLQIYTFDYTVLQGKLFIERLNRGSQVLKFFKRMAREHPCKPLLFDKSIAEPAIPCQFRDAKSFLYLTILGMQQRERPIAQILTPIDNPLRKPKIV